MTHTEKELTVGQIAFAVSEERIKKLRLEGRKNPLIGQQRAIEALELGLGIRADGYNIFIMGASGTGRRTVLTSLLAEYKANTSELQDIAYVYNFTKPLEPKALFFPPGTGAYFAKNLKSAIESIRRQALQITKSEVFAAARKRVISRSETDENQVLAEFETQMAAEGFKLIQIKDDDAQSMDLVPVIKGRAASFDELQELVGRGKFPLQQLNSLRERYYQCLDRMADLFKILREKRRATEKQIRALKAESASPIIDNELAMLRSLCKKTPENTEALNHLEAIREDLLARAAVFMEPFKSAAHKKAFFGRYAVNLVSEHPADKKYIIHEEVPTFPNLFGSIETTGATDDISINGHLKLRPGAVHRAMGGFLILRLQDLLQEDGAWTYLKRVLQSGKIEIQAPPSSIHGPSLLKPQAVPAKLKVVIIGGLHSYDFLYQEDPDFQKLFKVCAEFDNVMPLSDQNLGEFIAFCDDFIQKNTLLPIDEGGLARITAHAARLAEYRGMLTTRFIAISDLLTEADYQARKNGESAITYGTVAKTIERRNYLHRLPEEKYAEMIQSKEILLDVSGTSIGKVNGLAVQDRGYHAFGIPVAVTAQAAPGDAGVINIERESGLSGEIYDKAHLIIQGLLHRRYAHNIPLALSASICFEQSYTEVDGDSASCAEFFALLSAIAGIPLRQDIAITGSLNQLGDVQPVGGIPEKIEGFFDACSILGLTGTQGVIIPRRNAENLFIPDRMNEAVTSGRFHIWAIDTADEGLEILSGTSAKEFGDKVYTVLEDYAKRMQKCCK